MRTRSMLGWAAAACAAVLAVTAFGAQPALAAPKPRLPMPITSQPAAQSTLQSATFAWTVVSGATYTCSLDGSTATACSGTMTYTGLTDGTHTFVLRGKLNSGYRPNTRSISWQIDSILPGAPTVTAVPSPTRSTSANVSFTNPDPSAVAHTCSLDGAPETDCTSPYAVSSLTEGSHTVVVRAVDSSGNKSPASQVTWVVDLTSPANVLASGPVSPTNQTTAQATFSAAGATSYTCALDGAPAVACTSPYTVPGPIAEGAHSLVVNASDGAGNVAQPATVVWEVDVTAPWTPSIVTGPPAVTNQTVADFVAGDIDSSGTLQCRLDDAGPSGTWVPCPSPLSYTVAAGVHTLEVRSHDQAGNASTVASTTWEVDTTAPAPAAFTDGPPTPSKDTAPGFAWVATDGSTNGFECSLDNSAYATCDVGDWAFAPLTEGSHVFAVRSLDTATNWSSSVTWVWRVDLTAPAVPLFSTTPASSTTSTTALFSFASEPGASYTCSVDGATATNCASPVTLTGLTVGAHSFAVVAEDGAHNVSPQASFGWTVTVPGSGGGGGGGSTPPTGGPTPTPTPTTPTAAATATTITASSALRGTSTLRFSGDVSGVSAATVRLVASTGTSVPAALSCRDSAGSVVACSGTVRSVGVRPAAALLPGASYTLSVGTGLSGSGDSAVTPASTSFRASTKEQENSLRAGFTWAKGKAGSAFGKSYLVESHRGATLTTAVRGTKATWYTMTGPDQGKATVFVDGVRKGTVDNYSAKRTWRVARTVKGLSATRHTLKIVVTGTKSRASTGTGVVVDAVRVGKTLKAAPTTKATWRRAGSAKASGRAYSVASAAGASTSFTFRGTGVSWSTETAPTMGKVAVYLDGVRKATVDNYSAKAKWNVLRSITGLSNTTHTVKLVALGAKRKASRGTDVVVDRWLVR
jgi:hypothetical protein